MLLLLLALAADPPVPPAAHLNLVGFEEADIATLKKDLAKQAQACGAAELPLLTDAELPQPCEDACLANETTLRGGLIIAIEALRVGGDVETTERRVTADGSVVTTPRSLPAAAFEKQLLSPDTCAALKTAPVVEQTKEPEQPQTPPAAAPMEFHPGLGVAVAGGVVTLVGATAFGLDAATLEDPKSSGSAKENARVTGWVWLGVAVAGVAGAAAGAAWALQ